MRGAVKQPEELGALRCCWGQGAWGQPVLRGQPGLRAEAE